MKRLLKNLVRSRGALNNQSSSSAFSVQNTLITLHDPIIFDVGAKVGWATQKYRKLYPNARIYSFEPFQSSYEKLRANIGNSSLTKMYRLAISDSSGNTKLNANAAPGTSSLLPTDPAAASFWGTGLLETEDTVEVETTTIDDFCLANSIPRIDILKLDIQGAEYMALKGATDFLQKQLISVVYFEIIMVPTYTGQRTFHEYLMLMDSLGYSLFDLYNPVRKNLRLIQADVLFVSNKALSNTNST